jgi:hypothetical protein
VTGTADKDAMPHMWLFAGGALGVSALGVYQVSRGAWLAICFIPGGHLDKEMT